MLEQVKYLAFEDELQKIALTITGEKVVSDVRKYGPKAAKGVSKAIWWGPKIRIGKTLLEFPIGASIIASMIVTRLLNLRRNVKLKKRREEVDKLSRQYGLRQYRGFRVL